MNIISDEIKKILREQIADVDWDIQIPERGFSAGKRFIGVSSDQKVMVLFHVNSTIIQLLSQVNITPQYITSAYLYGIPVCIQEYIDAKHPDANWYSNNSTALAHVIKNLHMVDNLRTLLPKPKNEDYQTIFYTYINEIKKEYEKVKQYADRHTVETLLRKYEKRVKDITGEGLEPIHGDPNSGNILITKTNVYLTDWETLHLSDPMRDIALILYWFYPKEKWNDILQFFSFDLSDEEQKERFYLHISTRSLYVYLVFVHSVKSYLAPKFLEDAKISLTHKTPRELLVS